LGSVEKKKEEQETSSPSEKRDKQARARTRKGTRRCPADWQPREEEAALAASLGLDGEWQAEKMRDHTFSTPRSDWDATYRNWLRDAVDRGQARNGNGRHSSAPPRAAVDEADRMEPADLVEQWRKRQTVAPSERDTGKQAEVAKRICAEHPRAQIAAAWWGLTHRFPWARPPDGRCEAWDLGTLDTQFAKSVQYAMENHPDIKAERGKSDLREAILRRTGGAPP
jgi:hypothetical protein